MTKEGGIKTAKGFLFVLSRIAIVIVVIALVIVAFYAAMNTMNIRMVAKDAFTQRATAVLMDDEMCIRDREEIADTIHAHPTVSEMIMEAAHDVEGLCCHKLR